MAKLKVKLRPSSVPGKAGTIYYYLSHRKVVRHIKTTIHLKPEEWNEESAMIKDSVPGHANLQSRIEADLAYINALLRDFQLSGCDFTADSVVEKFKSSLSKVSVLRFFENQIQLLVECGRFGTARNYRSTLQSLKSFLKGRDLAFTELNSEFVEFYNEHLQRKGLVRNSISFYMRTLRAVFNKAVRRGLCRQSYPFRDVYTGIDKTRKRAVDEETVKRLIQCELPEKSGLAVARDMFLFSLFTRGMSFVDIAFLRKEDISGNAIHYKRRKTGQYLDIRIEPCIQNIIDKYIDKDADSSNPYVFPLLSGDRTQGDYMTYLSRLRAYNASLKQLSAMLGLPKTLSSYTARHTWANLARLQNIPLSVISQGMGHTSEKTTIIYLKSLENTLIDGANKTLLDSLNTLILNKRRYGNKKASS